MKTVLSCLAATLVAATAAHGQPAPTAEYKAMIEAAKGEGKVVIYAPIDAPAMRPLIDDFQSLYPGVTVEFTDMQTSALYNRYLSEMAAKAASADIIWNTPMDLQFKLVQDGYAAIYASAEKPNIPEWAVYKDQLYSITLDPGVFVYNKNVLEEDQIPKSHADLVPILEKHGEAFRDGIVAYDIEKAAGGFLMATQDAEYDPNFWTIPVMFGKLGAQFPTGTGYMIEMVGSGEAVLGYNQLGSAASKAARSNKAIGIVYPTDFVILQARTGFVSKAATHPNAARLMLDYLLSQRAQKIIAETGIAYAVRSDVDSELTLGALQKTVGASVIKPIRVGPELLEYLEPAKRIEFLTRWQKALRGDG